jgi:hypothetical protein
MNDRPRYLLEFVPMPSGIPPAVRLKRLLKLALRACELRCVRHEELPSEPGAPLVPESPPDAMPRSMLEG